NVPSHISLGVLSDITLRSAYSMRRSFVVLVLSGVFASAAFAQTASPTPESNPDKARADRLQGRLTDFPTLARYRDANAKLGPPAKGEDRVVFFGDSITDG